MDSGDESRDIDMKLLMKSMQDQFRRLNARLDDLESPSRSRSYKKKSLVEEKDDSDSDDGSFIRRRGKSHRHDDNIGTIKMKIPPFKGKNDPELYLEWERKVDHIFDCHNYSEEKKIKLAVVGFSDYASVWWDQLVRNKRRYGERPVSTWEEMKSIMQKRYVPSHYYRDLHRRLQGLTQGSRSVEDYYKEMEVAMIQAKVKEDDEATMARFIGGLNREIADVVDLQQYVDLEELLHKAVKVEKQLNSRGNSKYGSDYRSSWKSNWKNNQADNSSPKDGAKVLTSATDSQGNPEQSSSRARDIKCYKCRGLGHLASQCPNRRVMVVLENGDIGSESSNDEEMPPLEDVSEEEAPDEKLLAMVNRPVEVQVVEKAESQRERIFHTRCLVNNRVCSLMIDNGSCTNVVSSLLVDKLQLYTIKHPKPYSL